MTIEYIISESLKYGIHFDYKDFRYVSHKDRKVKFIFIILNDCLYWVGQKEDFEISHLSYCIEVLTNEKLSKLENIKKRYTY